MDIDYSLSAYHIFNAVARTGNISEAAKELFVSQPAISKAISKLEQSLEVTLFVRNSRGVILTDDGKQLYEHTKLAFKSLKEGEELMKRRHQLGVGHIRIGVSTTLCKYILLPYLKEVIDRYPHLRYTILCQSTFQTMELLSEGKLDIGLVGKSENMRGYEFYSMGQVEDIFIASKSYLDNLEIREGRKLSSEELLERATLMLLDEKNITRQYVEQYFRENRIKLGQVLEVSTMDLLIEFAKTGIGIACVFKEFVQQEIDQGIFSQIPMKQAAAKREVGFVYLNNKPVSDSVKKFLHCYHPFKKI